MDEIKVLEINHYLNLLLKKLIRYVEKKDNKRQLNILTEIRKVVSIENSQIVVEVAKAGLIPVLVSFLKRKDYPALQFEAVWCLTNMTAAENTTNEVLKTDAVFHLINLLASDDPALSEQAVWALGNIGGDNLEARNYVLNCNFIDGVLKMVIKSHKRVSTLRKAIWSLSNLYRDENLPKKKYILKSLPLICYLVYSKDQEVLVDSCWAFCYVTEDRDTVSNIFKTNMNVIKRLLDLMKHRKLSVQSPALRAIGNIIHKATDKQTDIMIKMGLICSLKELLNHKRRSIRKESLYSISNIVGTPFGFQQIMELEIFPVIVKNLRDSDPSLRVESAWALVNGLDLAKENNSMEKIVKIGAINALCGLLSLEDSTIVSLGFGGLSIIMKEGSKYQPNRYKKKIYKQCNKIIRRLGKERRDQKLQIKSFLEDHKIMK